MFSKQVYTFTRKTDYRTKIQKKLNYNRRVVTEIVKVEKYKFLFITLLSVQTVLERKEYI